MSKPKCPICGGRASPHRRGESLRKFPNALRVLGLEVPLAHPSCLIFLLNKRVKSRAKQGIALPVAPNPNPSSLLETLEAPDANDL